MNKDELKAKIGANMDAAGFVVERLDVMADPFGGWRIAIVSPDFVSLPISERKAKSLLDLDDDLFQWIDLLSPEELEWAGDINLDIEEGDLPLWTEALSKKQEPLSESSFPSDSEEDLPLPIVCTFYSLRGGVGRSTALSYTAEILASKGYSVLCIDADFEAPGLASLFGIEKQIEPEMGFVSLLSLAEQGEHWSLLDHIIRVSESRELYCLPAGQINANYARHLRLLSPENWYRAESNPLRKLLEQIPQLPFSPQVVLIDSRTGISPFSAPFLFDISDLAVVCFFPHPQSYEGTGALVRALLNAHTRRSTTERKYTPEPRFLISPVPATNKVDIERYHSRALSWINEWMSDSGAAEKDSSDSEEMMHLVPYQLAVATCDQILSEKSVWDHYRPVSEWLERFIPSKGDRISMSGLTAEKEHILSEIDFSGGTAEKQSHFLDTFVETELVKRAISANIPLVLGRKGTGKTAIFRWLTESVGSKSIVVMCASQFRPDAPWVLSPDGFKMIEIELKKFDLGWREFWTAYTTVSIFLDLQSKHRNPKDAPADIQPFLSEWSIKYAKGYTELGIVELLTHIFSKPSSSLFTWDWLNTLDKSLGEDSVLLYDGLDTGFGSQDEERLRRTRAIEGLLSFVVDREPALKHFRPKLLLREDIWKSIKFQNKSHLFGRSVRLEWQNQTDYQKTVLKQAWRSPSFKKLVNDKLAVQNGDVDSWTEHAATEVWNILVGERMRGGRTAFTKNWVWNRLADANGDHTPRSLIQLFREAKDWEKQEHARVPYDRSLVRPRALILSLDAVSREATEALREEFHELESVLDRLKEAGRTPVEYAYLQTTQGLELAKEVGLLAIYEGTEDTIVKYRVPDVYRLALGMTRKGQA